jgi:hypothetical protein
MPQPKSDRRWVDHLATIGVGLSLASLLTLSSGIPWFLVGGLLLLWLLWGVRYWRGRSRPRTR